MQFWASFLVIAWKHLDELKSGVNVPLDQFELDELNCDGMNACLCRNNLWCFCEYLWL